MKFESVLPGLGQRRIRNQSEGGKTASVAAIHPKEGQKLSTNAISSPQFEGGFFFDPVFGTVTVDPGRPRSHVATLTCQRHPALSRGKDTLTDLSKA